LKVDREALEDTFYRIVTPKDLERLLSATGPGGKFPPEPGFMSEFYHPSPELINSEAKQFLARVQRELEDYLLFTKPLITFDQKGEE
jgi:hypothetical protein